MLLSLDAGVVCVERLVDTDDVQGRLIIGHKLLNLLLGVGVGG